MSPATEKFQPSAEFMSTNSPETCRNDHPIEVSRRGKGMDVSSAMGWVIGWSNAVGAGSASGTEVHRSQIVGGQADVVPQHPANPPSQLGFVVLDLNPVLLRGEHAKPGADCRHTQRR